MRLDEIAYKRHAEWKELTPTSMNFDVDGVEWFATLSSGRVNEHFITGMLACGPHGVDLSTGAMGPGLSARQKMKQAMVGFHTVGQWLASLAKKHPNASISVTIYPASSSRSSIYRQLIDQLVKEIPGAKVDHSEVKEHGDVYHLYREASLKQASFPPNAFGERDEPLPA